MCSAIGNLLFSRPVDVLVSDRQSPPSRKNDQAPRDVGRHHLSTLVESDIALRSTQGKGQLSLGHAQAIAD